jgi:hypothetical protein
MCGAKTMLKKTVVASIVPLFVPYESLFEINGKEWGVSKGTLICFWGWRE